MVQIIEPEANIAGRIGHGFGKGLAESLPKDIQTGRLSHAFKSLGENPQENFLEQSSRLARAGVGVNEIMALVPYIREQQQTQAFRERSKNASGKSGGGTPSTPGINAPSQKKMTLGQKQVASPEQIRSSLAKFQQEPTPDQIDELARELIENGEEYTRDKARTTAKARLQEGITSQQTRVSNFDKLLSNRIETDLQSVNDKEHPDFDKAIGEVRQRLLDTGKTRLIEGQGNEEIIAKDMEEIAKELNKNNLNLRAAGAANFLTKTYPEKIKDAKANRKFYKDLGFEEQYDDMAAGALNISPMMAASYLDPLRNKEILENTKQKKLSIPLRIGTREINLDKLPEEKLKKVIDSIGNEDNILSVLERLRDQNYDISQLRDKLLELRDTNKKSFTNKQSRQLDKPVRQSIYGDFLFSSFGGEK